MYVGGVSQELVHLNTLYFVSANAFICLDSHDLASPAPKLYQRHNGP